MIAFATGIPYSLRGDGWGGGIASGRGRREESEAAEMIKWEIITRMQRRGE